MGKFNVGDKVVFTGDGPRDTSIYLKKGEVYTVRRVYMPGTIELEETPGFQFASKRFTAATLIRQPRGSKHEYEWGLPPDIEPETTLTKDIPAPAKPADWRMRYDNSSARRKEQPVAEGVLDYMPAAIRLAAELSRLGNEKHNPGQPLHHARTKSTDHRNCAARHIMDADVLDEFGLIEAISAFWRIGIYIQEKCERDYGWPKAPRAIGEAPFLALPKGGEK